MKVKQKILATRDSIRGYTSIDMSNVEFISRSVAHYIITNNIKVFNVNKKVQKMLDIVKKQLSNK